MACGTDGGSSDGRPTDGSEGGWCYGNGTCDQGLACRSDLCVSLGSGGSDGGSGGSRGTSTSAGSGGDESSTGAGGTSDSAGNDSGGSDAGGSSGSGGSGGDGGGRAGNDSGGGSASSGNGGSGGNGGAGGTGGSTGSGTGGDSSSGGSTTSGGGSGGTLADPGLDTTPITLTSGLHFVVSVRDGKLYNWGFNGSYQLGTGDQISQSTPIRVGTFDNVVSVSAQRYHTCMALSDGRVYCWGSDNGWGETGGFSDGMNEVDDVDDAVAVAVGSDHSCALNRDHTVTCWGRSSSGQLGPEYVDWDSAFPTLLPDITDARILSCGTDFCCIVLGDRSVQCWGNNYYGTLGSETEASFSSTPLSVPELSDVISISAGATHVCALRAGGSVWCWGSNSVGQLGQDFSIEKSAPVKVEGIDEAVKVSAGASGHSCAINSDGTAVCWGNNYRGGLGNGDTENSFVPVPVSGLRGLDAITAGGVGCARSGGDYYCWGDNPGGALGNGDFDLSYSTVPVQVAAPQPEP